MKMLQITEHFNWIEAMCKDGTPVPQEYQANVGLVASNMELVRRALGGTPIHVVSWYRTEEWNKKLPNASKHSQHLTASAMDFWHDIYSPKELYMIMNVLIQGDFIRQGGLGLYNQFVHYDIRGIKARWDLRTIK